MTKLELLYPPSINHYFSVVRARPVLTKDVRLYRHHVRECVLASDMQMALGPLAVRLDLSPPDTRRRDCDNVQKPILDALQQAGAFVDDSQIVWLLTVKSAPVSEGKVIVTIRQTVDGLPDAEFSQLIPSETKS